MSYESHISSHLPYGKAGLMGLSSGVGLTAGVAIAEELRATKNPTRPIEYMA
jgi:hypothetical protein